MLSGDPVLSVRMLNFEEMTGMHPWLELRMHLCYTPGPVTPG